MDNISNTTKNMVRDDSISFYKSLKAGQGLLPLIEAGRAKPPETPIENFAIKNGKTELHIKNDSNIVVANNIKADIFITSADVPSLKIILSLGEETEANVFWVFKDGQQLHGLVQLETNLARASILNQFSFLSFQDATRLQQLISLKGVGAVANIFVGGKNNPTNNQQPAFADSTIRVVHEAKDSLSQIVVRGVVDNQDVMVGQVRTDIDIDATGANTIQDIKATVLSPEAKFYGKPELNIKHDRVKAKHGLSIGAMDDDQIYYLTSRGINKKVAQELLMTSFFMNGLYIFDGKVAEEAAAWLEPFITQPTND